MDTEHGWITTPVTADLLRGALELERTAHGVLPHRLPAWARAQCADRQLAMAESQPSGVRLVFRTRATAVELDVLPTKRVYAGAPPRPDGVYDLLVDGRPADRAGVAGGNTLTIDMAAGTAEHRPGPVGTLRFTGLPGRAKDVEIWLPHNETTELVALRTDAPVRPAPDRGRAVWLHHGSSISHGSDAASPATTWPALAATLAGVELINLGLGGGALLDPFTARVMRDTPADLISVKIGINLVNNDLMRLRAFTPAVHGFLDTIREGRPTTPLLVVSPILCPIHEDTPGPSAPDLTALGAGRVRFRAAGEPAERANGKLTLGVIRDELARIVRQRAAEDANLHHLDGRALYGPVDSAELPLPDRLHPDAATHRRMGERFAELVFTAGGPFADRGGDRAGHAVSIGFEDCPALAVGYLREPDRIAIRYVSPASSAEPAAEDQDQDQDQGRVRGRSAGPAADAVTVREVADAWGRITGLLRRSAPDSYAALRPGASPAAVAAPEDGLGIRIPVELRTLWSPTAGDDGIDGRGCLPGNEALMPLDAVAACCRLKTDSPARQDVLDARRPEDERTVVWKATWIPVVSLGPADRTSGLYLDAATGCPGRWTRYGAGPGEEFDTLVTCLEEAADMLEAPALATRDKPGLIGGALVWGSGIDPAREGRWRPLTG